MDRFQICFMFTNIVILFQSLQMIFSSKITNKSRKRAAISVVAGPLFYFQIYKSG